jgi:HEAT repeat protein
MRRLFAIAVTFVLTATTVHAADVADLIKQLKDKDADKRRAAAEELSKAGKEAMDAGPALIVALKDSDIFVRAFSAQALGDVGADPKKAVPALAALFKNAREKAEVLESAAGALGKLGMEAVPALIALVKNVGMDNNIRRKAIGALGQIGPDAHLAVPVLTEVVNGGYKGQAPKAKKGAMPADDLRPDAATALGEIANQSDSGAITALKQLGDGKKKQKGLKKLADDALRKIQARKV